MSFLTLDGVGRRFGAVQALKGISLSVEKGELRAIIGPNGAGKTTLFNLISGYFPPSEGSIKFDGQPILAVSPNALVRRGIIRTFQITQVFLSLSVYENLRVAVETAMGLQLRPWISRNVRNQVEAKVEELAAITRIGPKMDRIVGEMSHGDQRVVEVGIALSRHPKLLLLDEPTAGMGDEETNHMTDLIRRLNKEQGITILFVEHDMAIVFGIADRITVLDNGTMLAEGTAREISENPACNRPISAMRWRRTRHERGSGNRWCAHLLRQEPYSARRVAEGGGGRAGGAAGPQWRWQNHHHAQRDEPHAAKSRQCETVRA
ncbi:ABC transporter ATP-binding protein [Acidocella sp. MX-AZ03]|uniref:ABC transporter ATP-binding protein n=1 Tax=Acidocella sp. MX-AZ03 TaxID=2697363 RepID=UPI0022DDC605|nr:ABC transporter ATP-binding protein [Acidocella sp. MX-AZ03]WBO58127.1 ABC transporter ATP-binding protein [Acidocella sp. MX-AZ03]